MAKKQGSGQEDSATENDAFLVLRGQNIILTMQ